MSSFGAECDRPTPDASYSVFRLGYVRLRHGREFLVTGVQNSDASSRMMSIIASGAYWCVTPSGETATGPVVFFHELSVAISVNPQKVAMRPGLSACKRKHGREFIHLERSYENCLSRISGALVQALAHPSHVST